MTETKETRKVKLLELHALVLDHLIELLRSGKTLKGTTLAIIMDFLKLNHVALGVGQPGAEEAESYLLALKSEPLPFT